MSQGEESFLLPKQFEFINKELDGTKITSKLLTELLHQEEKRKALLEARVCLCFYKYFGHTATATTYSYCISIQFNLFSQLGS